MLPASSHVRALAAAVLVALTLTACSGPAATPTPTATSAVPTETASATPTATATPTPVPVSASIDGISVTGAAGAAPEVKIPTPFAIDTTRSRVVIAGSGPTVAADSVLELHYSGYNARTGAMFDSSWDDGKPALMSLQQVVTGFQKGLVDKKPGDRVLIAMPGSEGYDASGGNADIGIEVGDTLVFVVDIIATTVSTATGTTVSASVPVTIGDEAGKPTVTIPGGIAPPQLLVQRLIQGSQRVVGESDYVMVHYRSWSWKTGKIIEDSFDTPDYGRIAETIPAWRKGIVGQPIGSRVLIIAPPAEGYGGASVDPPVDADDTVVFIVDILFSTAQTG